MRLVSAAFLPLALAALLAPPAAWAQAHAHGREVVALRFAWPERLEAQVIQRVTRTRTGQPTRRSTTRFAQLAARDGDRHRISVRDVRFEGDLPIPPGAGVTRADFVAATEAIVQLVTAQGELAAIEGTEPVKALLQKTLEASDVPKAQLERAVALGDAALRAESQEAWNLAVGFWIGAELELGERYGLENEAELPLLPGTTARYEVEFGVARKVPCAPGEKAARCVEIGLRSVPDPEVMPRITTALVERMAGPEVKIPEAAIQGVEVENELVLVTEPSTLVPHRLVWTKAIRVTALGEGETARTLEQLDRREWDYDYAPAKKPAPAKRKKSAAKKRAAAGR
ncbi:MAG TPA: hypothetical protein VD838_00420 [Anaeromyxobacteraceae bacterium]|nr:hypothetical protein [Anaeromyxobacteraceae bacterium]